MIYIDELKDFKLYSRPFLLPRNKDKKLGALALLLTPNYESTKEVINNKFIINKYYNSYYLEKDVSLYLNNDGSLHRPIKEEYVHESVTGDEIGYIDEGVYSRFREEIIYNGYSADVNDIKKFITVNMITECNKDLGAPIKYPISITVYPVSNSRTDIINNRGLSIQSRASFTSDEIYSLYCRECVYEFLVRSINQNINDALCEAISMVLAGTYQDSKEWVMQNTNLYFLCDVILSIISESNGYRKLYTLIKRNNLNDFSKYSNKLIVDKIGDLYVQNEVGQLDIIKKLKRKIRFSARKGSAHITNKINRVVNTTVDPNADSYDPTIKSDDPNSSNITPNLTDIKNQINSAGGKGSTSSSKENTKNSNIPTPKTESLDDDYTFLYDEIITENYIKINNFVQFFTEAEQDPRLYKILYKERLRNNRDIKPIYDRIKQDCPIIENTFFNLNMYKKKNLFIDLFYYNEIYFRNTENMSYKKRLEIYLSLLDKMINNNSRYINAGYTDKRVLIIPVNDYDNNPKTKMWLYSKDLNPVSLIYELLQNDKNKLKEVFGNIDIIFLSDKGYFKVNFNNIDSRKESLFLPLIKQLRAGNIIEDEDKNIDSKSAIVNSIIDDIEDKQNIKISHLVGDIKTNAKDEKKIEKIDQKTINNIEVDAEKKEIIDKIKQAADTSKDVDSTLEKLDNDEQFKEMIAMLNASEDNAIKLNSARTARIDELDKKLMSKKVKGKTVKELLEQRSSYASIPLEKISLKVDSINPEWKELTYPSLSRQYDPDSDIVAILEDLKNKSYPISIIDLDVEDTSTSEDYIYTYTVKMENHTGKRWTYKFDIPIMVNNQYMMLRGNKKVMSTQSFLMPIIKTDVDTAQIISNYNKIFIRRFGNAPGKSNQICDKIIKGLKKVEDGKSIKVNWTPCDSQLQGYDLPIDYIDFASNLETIETTKLYFCFNIRHFVKEYNKYIDLSKGIPIGINKVNHTVYYFSITSPTVSSTVYSLLSSDEKLFEAIKSSSASTKYAYSKASILNTEIPLIIVAAYSVGLTEVLDKAKINYNFVEKKSTKEYDPVHYDWIKFNDGYLVYQIDYSSSLLLNGLKESPTDMYSISEMNNKTTYIDFLENYGGRIKADGIDNFYDCLIDPITKDVLKHYEFPTDYIECLIYANNLLSDNKYYTHSVMSPRRFRKGELIAGYAYKCIALSYGTYSTQLKHGRDVPMTIKQSAIIDAILLDPTCTDLSVINPLNEKEMYDAVTTKGLSGLNSDRSYSLDKRAYDDSMTNVLSMSTGFAATVGINRQATINANVDTVRGYVKPSKLEDCNSINTMCMSEALTPMGTTRDDPFRSAMTFIQTTRHEMKVKHSDPLLVTNGADQALPYLISDTFVHKAKYDGEIVELIPDEFMIIKHKHGGSEYVDLSNKIEKNSSSGIYTNVKLDTDLKKGSKVKQGQIIAYDKEVFNDSVGLDNNPAYDIGTLAKVALMDTDEGFEDSAIISNALSEAMTSTIIKKKEITILKSTNVYNLIEVGTPVEEGDTLMIMQSSFEENDANVLLKNLTADEKEVSDLGRIPIRSSVTGRVHAIEMYRTVEIDELSPSLQKIFKKYEANIKKKKNIAKQNGVSDNDLKKIGNDYKLEATGKLKDASDGVKIIIHLSYEDKFSIGDKLVFWSANKGVCKDIIPKGLEPYSLDRPNEKIHSLVSIASINGRMVTSIQNIGVINRLLIEAGRKAKDILGIEYDDNLI